VFELRAYTWAGPRQYLPHSTSRRVEGKEDRGTKGTEV
jgi:hypothetical protein